MFLLQSSFSLAFTASVLSDAESHIPDSQLALPKQLDQY